MGRNTHTTILNLQIMIKKEKTVIEKIIVYSQAICYLKLARVFNTQTQTCLNKSNINVYDTKDALKVTNDLVSYRIEELNRAIKPLLKPLFQGIDFGYDRIWWLSQKDMRQGYILLEKVKSKDSLGNITEFSNEKYILLLKNYKDKAYSYQEGSLLQFNQVSFLLGEFSN